MFNQTPFMMFNPAYQAAPSAISAATGAKSLGFLSKINWSTLLSNTQKALNVANQAIPLYYQVKPVVSNIRALGKIGKELNNVSVNDVQSKTKNIDNEKKGSIIQTEEKIINEPTFFL